MTRAIADSRGGVLKVASNPSLSTHVMPRALAAFRARHPGTFLRFQTETTIQEVAEKLLSGEVDTAVLSIPAEHPFLSSQVLCRSEENTSELQSLMRISYAVFCLKKKK